MIFPWHQDLLAQVVEKHRRNILPHAIMVSGGRGLGAGALVHALAASVLCESTEQNEACGQCKSCHLLEAGSHNDFIQLSPEDEGKQIKVDEVRRMVAFLTESSMRGGHKVAIIDPVEALNINGANALLKTLEEPAGDTVIFLVSERQEAVLPTIRSRCQIMTVPVPRTEESLKWLQQQTPNLDESQLESYLDIAHQEPLRAERYIEQGAWEQQLEMLNGLSQVLKRQVAVPHLAASWNDDYLSDRLEWLLLWAEQLIRFASTKDTEVFTHEQSKTMLEYLAKRATFEQLFELREVHLEQLRLHKGTTNPNSALLCEALILHWLALM